MISVNELRIGNLVNEDEYVIGISFDGSVEVSYDSIEKGNATRFIDISTCNPIPLTEEWLVKMGFEIDRTGDLSIMINSAETHLFFNKVKDCFYPMILVEAEFSGLDSNCVGLNSIQHVHQLQNLYFALTGEELNFTP